MKCPLCSKESKARVIESRRLDGEVWRKRLCGKCLKEFVTHETTNAEMRFPWGERKRQRRAQENKDTQKVPRFVVPTKLW